MMIGRLIFVEFFIVKIIVLSVFRIRRIRKFFWPHGSGYVSQRYGSGFGSGSFRF